MSTSQASPSAPATGTRTMTAVVQDVYGDTEDVLRVDRVLVPDIGDDEVLVRVHAAGLDRGTWHLMAGKPYAARLVFGLRRPKNPVRGREFAGVVVQIGDEVSTVRPGDAVFGVGEGSFAEYVVARARKIAPKPATLTFEQAAAAAVSASTALQAVRARAKVRPGQKVLVIGASGGVGTFAVQIAKAYGAEVTGVSSTAKVDLVRSLGADHVLDYTTDDLPVDGRYDVVLFIGGNSGLRTLRRALAPAGTLVVVGGEDGGKWLGMGRQLRAMAVSPFVRQRLVTFVQSENAADLVVLAGLFEAGSVTSAVDRLFPLAETPAAVRYMREGRARGKVVVTVDDARA
jgi:NADPH:quinone reductase-like Zn-dependent oxidoreductase